MVVDLSGFSYHTLLSVQLNVNKHLPWKMDSVRKIRHNHEDIRDRTPLHHMGAEQSMGIYLQLTHQEYFM